jgi:DNA-binding transcriptional LysR family regulator
MAEVDLRKLRYFLAVAEQLNFGRAAQQLHIAQPVLSRQIRALESELNAQLFVRGSRGTSLTAAGEQLRIDAATILNEAAALRRRVARAARGRKTFTVAFTLGVPVTEPVRQLRTAHPELEVEIVRTGWDDQISVLHDGRADVAYLRRPVDEHGLQLCPLYSEPRVVLLPITHRLAGKDVVHIADLADEDLIHADLVPEWRAATGPRRRRVEPTISAVEEKLEHVASGRRIAIMPESSAESYRRPDVVYARVADIAPVDVCIAWLSTRRSPLISEFVTIATSQVDPRR